MFKIIKFKVVSLLDWLNEFLNMFRFKLLLWFFKIELGWFSGEPLHVVKLRIYENIDYHYYVLFELQILKFNITIFIEF